MVLAALFHILLLWNEAVATLFVGLVHSVLECKDLRPESSFPFFAQKQGLSSLIFDIFDISLIASESSLFFLLL